MNHFTDVFYLCHPTWDFAPQAQRHAATTIAMGFFAGFRQLGIAAHATCYGHILEEIEGAERPFLILSYDDYNYLKDDELAIIQHLPHVIWVNAWFNGMAERAKQESSLDPTIPTEVVRRILDSEASFLFCSSLEAFFSYYENWIHAGQRLISVPLACNTDVYFPRPWDKRYSDIEVAYVQGYYSFREATYQQFLYPYGSQLATFGYNEWPRAYRGYLPNDEEAVLYQNAKVAPTIHEPFMRLIGDIHERPFKIMGSGGLTIIDPHLGCRQLFAADELLVANSVNEFHELMHLALTDEAFNKEWRRKGTETTLARHTYRHRAETILRAFEKGMGGE